jgi:hypothetical protein
MLHQTIKKVVKPQALLIIISLIFSCLQSYCQVDTAKLRKEIALVLKKYGLKEPLFELKIQSTNQKGGQTAYVINNYNGKNIHVINGNNYGVNGDIINGIKQRHLENNVVKYLLTQLPNKDEEIVFLFSGGKEGLNYANEIYNMLIAKGYSKLKPANWMDPDDFDKVYVIKKNGETQIRICPASNVN